MHQRVELCCRRPGTTGSELATEVGKHTHTESLWVPPSGFVELDLGICDAQ